MLALFYEHPDGQLKFIADAATSQAAIYLGKRWSLEKQMPVVGFENRRDGTTHECCRFESGELVGIYANTGEIRRENRGQSLRAV